MPGSRAQRIHITGRPSTTRAVCVTPSPPHPAGCTVLGTETEYLGSPVFAARTASALRRSTHPGARSRRRLHRPATPRARLRCDTAKAYAHGYVVTMPHRVSRGGGG